MSKTTSTDVERAAAQSIQLIDARDDAHYLGLSKSSSVNGVGHIPGAKNVYTGLMSTQSGEAARLLAPETYRDIFKFSGIDPQAPAITYCNTGSQASGTWFVLHEILGNKQVRLYDGSLHQWALEKRPMIAVSRGR